MDKDETIKLLDIQVKLLSKQIQQLSVDNAGLKASLYLSSEENKDHKELDNKGDK